MIMSEQIYRVVKTTKAKAWAAALGVTATVLGAVFADDVLDTSEVSNLVAGIVTAAATVYAVYKTPNKPTQ
jgi:hypothetical protein